MRFLSTAALVGLAQMALGQQNDDLVTATAKFKELAEFSLLLAARPSLLSALTPSTASAVTVLAPDNAAFDKYHRDTGKHVSFLSDDQLKTIFQYHTMAARMTSKDFAAPRSLVVPTLLQDAQYNNRSAGAQLVAAYGADAARGNVLYISHDPIRPAKLRVRRAGKSPSASLRGGLGGTATMATIDGQFSRGSFHIVDTILSPPMPCSKTVRSLSGSLSRLDNALSRTGQWDSLNASKNVTCLAPNNAAFKLAGSADDNLSKAALTETMLFHTLPTVTYSNYLINNTVIKSLAGFDVRIRMVGDDIYFNDAKVVSPDVVTNNGVIHVLDRVMSHNGTAPTSPPPPTPTPSPKHNAAGVLSGNLAAMGLVACGAAAALLI